MRQKVLGKEMNKLSVHLSIYHALVFHLRLIFKGCDLFCKLLIACDKSLPDNHQESYLYFAIERVCLHHGVNL